MDTDPARHRRQDGAAAVEFALVVLLLVPLLFGIVQFGISFAQKGALDNAARHGARLAAASDDLTCGEIFEETREVANALSMSGGDVDVFVHVGVNPPISVTSAQPTTNPAPLVCDTTNGPPNPDTTVPCSGLTPGDPNSVYVLTRYSSDFVIPLVIVEPEFLLQGRGAFRCEFA